MTISFIDYKLEMLVTNGASIFVLRPRVFVVKKKVVLGPESREKN